LGRKGIPNRDRLVIAYVGREESESKKKKEKRMTSNEIELLET
jgi:hypothetical protein